MLSSEINLAWAIALFDVFLSVTVSWQWRMALVWCVKCFLDSSVSWPNHKITIAFVQLTDSWCKYVILRSSRNHQFLVNENYANKYISNRIMVGWVAQCKVYILHIYVVRRFVASLKNISNLLYFQFCDLNSLFHPYNLPRYLEIYIYTNYHRV